MATVASYANFYRLFQVEDDDNNAIIDGMFLNSDTGSNAITGTLYDAASYTVGTLLPGNLIIEDTTSTNLARPNALRPSNTATSVALPDPSTVLTLADSGAGGTFAATVYTAFYVGKNASGQVTAHSANATVTPTASHGVNVTVPSTGTSLYTSADIYITEGTVGGANAIPLFLGNILAASFNAPQTYTAPPAGAAAAAPASVNTTTRQISGLSRVRMGLVFGGPVYTYMPTDNSIPNGQPVSMISGNFTAVLDSNSFTTAPTALGDVVYPNSVGTAKTSGLLSTTAVATGATGTTSSNLALGYVLGFDQWSSYGGPGVQQSGSYSSATSATASLVGGSTLVRVRFQIPYLPVL